MPRLTDRNRQIPGGMFFYEPSTGFKTSPWSSFDSIVSQVVSHRQGNPALAKKNGLALDRESVANEIDAFMGKVCEQMGWTEYYTAGEVSPPAPFSQAALQRSSQLVAGARTIEEMLGSEGPVDLPVAESRAAVCAACPMNEKGDLLDFFTAPVATALRGMIGLLHARKLATSQDAKLSVCSACGCPCKTKVWARLPHILHHMPAHSTAALHPSCWILKEQGK